MHSFPAKAVAVAGRWSKGQWINGASKAELEKKDDEHQAETKRLLMEKDEENEGMRAELARLR